MTTPSVTVNGEQRPVGDVEPHVTALDWLRDQGFTGTKEGCAEGECGACAVLVARPGRRRAPDAGRTRWTAINACLVPVLALDGQEVVTAEGLGRPGALHPVQREMAVRGGSQCGYCTPGFICSWPPSSTGRTALRPTRRPQHATGTRAPTTSTARTASTCTRCAGTCAAAPGTGRSGTPPTRSDAPPRTTPSPAAAARPRRRPPATRVRVGDAEFVRPADLAEALALLAERPDATVVAGCTDWGVEVNMRGTPGPVRGGRGPAARAAHVRGRRRPASRSAPRSPCPRSSGGSTGGSRCWTSCCRSSRPG